MALLFSYCSPLGLQPWKICHRGLSKTVIKKLLIANRGEIACRVARTAKKLGIKVVAVYSDADCNALHLSVADEAYNIGPAAPTESYLRGDKLLAVAQKAGCQAIHPGYGFLSENALFAEECSRNNIIFVGPPSSAIRDMGCKSTSKTIMEKAGVPVIKGYHGKDQSDSKLKQEAQKIGYPVMIKALKGGGGKGMRVVMKESEFDSQLSSARNEAQKAFGDSAMLVEAFVLKPRHVEVQIFGDLHGNYVHLYERDCSVQRRHQKIIEESPAPGLDEKIRQGLGETAVKAARAVAYVGAGTVEFIFDDESQKHYFMEMNTRLQVEHPVTEKITGTDLVEWQLKVASGEPLPLQQDEIKAHGHAFEARVYAEDPEQDFLPQAGSLKHLKLPPEGESVRLDTGIKSGDVVSIFYDPLIAKLVVWGADRAQALRILDQSLVSFQVSGVPTNINFLLKLVRHHEFQLGNVHTNFIPFHGNELLSPIQPNKRLIAAAIAAKIFCETRVVNPSDAFLANPGFRVNHNLTRKVTLGWREQSVTVNVEYLDLDSKRLTYLTKDGINEDFVMQCNCERSEDGTVNIRYLIDSKVDKAVAMVDESSIQTFTNEGVFTFRIPPAKWLSLSAEGMESGDITHLATSPMPGVIDQIMVKPGQSVTKNQPLVTVIAMKMEYVVRAPADGVVAKVSFKSGDAVPKGAVLVLFQDEKDISSRVLEN